MYLWVSDALILYLFFTTLYGRYNLNIAEFRLTIINHNIHHSFLMAGQI